MLSSDEWELLQKLVMVLGPFEEATHYLSGENYITYSMMDPLIKRIKNLLLVPSSSSSTSSSTSPTSSTSPVIAFNTPEIYREIENAPDVFIMIEEVEILENNIVENNNNQTEKNKIDLDKPLETKDLLDKVKKDLYNAMCFYWEVLSKDYLLSTLLDSRTKLMDNSAENKEILYKKYEEYKESYLLTPNESRAPSPIPSDSSVTLDSIYKPRLFSIFEQNQPKASDEVGEYLKEDVIPYDQCPFNW